MTEDGKASGRAIRVAKLAAIVLCLAAPSVWMLATVPPLWRDVDGYNQLIQDPRISTFWGWGAAYGYLAKVPVLLAEQAERLVAGAAQPVAPFPALNDARIAALIATQHLALLAAAVAFVCAVSRLFAVRFLLALIWASNALFYTFAHSIGSESLSVIVVLLLVTQCLRLVLREFETTWKRWLGFATTLLLCLLSRPINGLLIFLLPATFLITLFFRRERQELRHLAISIVLGIAAVMIASSTTDDLARNTRLHPHSRLGFTFLWRLQFLQTLTPSDRHALLDRVAERIRSEKAKQLLALLRKSCDEGTLDPGAFSHRAPFVLFPDEPMMSWEKADLALNEMARGFLVPPGRELLRAATADFVDFSRMPVAAIPDHLFHMSAYYFDHKSDMTGCAGLTTFRDYDAATLKRLPSDLRYFQLWDKASYNWALLGWLVILAGAVVVHRWKSGNLVNVIAFGIALVVIGTLMVVISCLLTEALPRYALPMWQMLLLSSLLLLGQLLDACVVLPVRREVRRAA